MKSCFTHYFTSAIFYFKTINFIQQIHYLTLIIVLRVKYTLFFHIEEHSGSISLEARQRVSKEIFFYVSKRKISSKIPWYCRAGDKTFKIIHGLFDVFLKLIFCFPRTDSGVHALSAAAHFDLRPLGNYYPSGEDIQRNVNRYLNKSKCSIYINEVFRVPTDFDARYNPISRTYLYR